MSDDRDRPWSWPAWEKHITALLVAVVAFVGWRVYAVTENTSDKVIELSGQLTALQDRIDDWKDSLRSRYDQRFMDVDRRINENRTRIERLENKEVQ